MKVEPLISCLCVTRERTHLLHRAIRSFRDQTYTHKELVIIYESDDSVTGEYLKGITDNNIYKIEVPALPRHTLGQLRNLAVSKSRGEYFCQWDDDDFSHNERLSFQMNVLQQSSMPACVMVHWLIFDEFSGQAYVSNMRAWEGSIMCRKSLVGDEIQYEDQNKGEDTPLISKLFSKNLVCPIVMPKLYVYVYHGDNVWTEEHWDKIFKASRKLSAESSQLIRDILDGKYTGNEASSLLDELAE
ncbi:MAG: glycosyltransferase family A protein [Thermodesulfobacteriota bacterium]